MSKLDRTVIGNQADEMGAFESGASADALNSYGAPVGRRDLIESNVAVTMEGGSITGVEIVPQRYEDQINEAMRRSLGQLQEGPIDVLSAQLLEEPDESLVRKRHVNGVEIEVSPRRVDAISRREKREQLVWYGQHPEYFGAVLGDRILVLKDLIESEHTCRTCKGLGYSPEEKCVHCDGAANRGDSPCPSCRVLGFTHEAQFSCGHRPCSTCRGTGWRNGIVIPEDAQQEAISGIVVSIGPDCTLMKIGDRIIHSRFAGHTLKTSKTESFVIMHESEALQILRQRKGASEC